MNKKRKPQIKKSNIKSIEITLHVSTGNLIWKKFDNLEDALEFVNTTARNSEKIREIISPKRGPKKVGEQMGFYNTDDDDDDW